MVLAERPHRGEKLSFGRRGRLPGVGSAAVRLFVAAARKSPNVNAYGSRCASGRRRDRLNVTGGVAYPAAARRFAVGGVESPTVAGREAAGGLELLGAVALRRIVIGASWASPASWALGQLAGERGSSSRWIPSLGVAGEQSAPRLSAKAASGADHRWLSGGGASASPSCTGWTDPADRSQLAAKG